MDGGGKEEGGTSLNTLQLFLLGVPLAMSSPLVYSTAAMAYQWYTQSSSQVEGQMRGLLHTNYLKIKTKKCNKLY